MTVESFTPSVLKITESALHKVKNLVEEEENAELCLRVYVTGGGCSGFQYGFSFDDDIAEDDETIVVALFGAINAQLGKISAHTYIIGANDSGSTTTSSFSCPQEATKQVQNGITKCHFTQDPIYSKTCLGDKEPFSDIEKRKGRFLRS